MVKSAPRLVPGGGSAQQPVEIALGAAGAGGIHAGGKAHHPVAHRVDDVKMIRERTAGTGLAVVEARQSSEQHAREKVLAIAESLARSPGLPASVTGPKPTDALQPLAEGIRKASGASFVVIAGANGVRYSHPNPALIGKPIDEDFHTVLAGKTWRGVENGTLGVSARGKAPIFDGQNRVIGIVSVGFLEGTLSQQLAAMLPQLALYMLVATQGWRSMIACLPWAWPDHCF